MEKILVTIRGDSMWPTLTEGQKIVAIKYHNQEIKVGQIVIFNHPFDNNVIAVKRVKVVDDGRLFVEGDNPDPTAVMILTTLVFETGICNRCSSLAGLTGSNPRPTD